VSTLIRNATILTMSDRLDIVQGAVGVRNGRIVSIGPEPEATWEAVIDAGGAFLLPGFIQTHIHLCQTLFRGYADDMPLLDWLKRCVWPMEAAHTPSTLRAATRLAAAGVPLVKLQEWLGHEDIATTQIYIDYQPSAQDGELIERAFGSDPLRLDQGSIQGSNLSETRANSQDLKPHSNAG